MAMSVKYRVGDLKTERGWTDEEMGAVEILSRLNEGKGTYRRILNETCMGCEPGVVLVHTYGGGCSLADCTRTRSRGRDFVPKPSLLGPETVSV